MLLHILSAGGCSGRFARSFFPFAAAAFCHRIASTAKSSVSGGVVEIFVIAVIVIPVLYLFSAIKILREYERGVIFSLGRLRDAAKGPGLIMVFAPVQKMVRIDLRQQALEVPPQDVITRDNVTLKVNAVVYWRVVDAPQAVVQVQNYYWQTQQFAQTTLRSTLGEVELAELLAP